MTPHSENESHRSLAHRLMGLTASDLTLEPLLLELFAKKPGLVRSTQQLLQEIETARAEKKHDDVPAQSAEKTPVYVVFDNDRTLTDDIYVHYLESKGFSADEHIFPRFQKKDREGFCIGHSVMETMIESSNSLPEEKRFTRREMEEFSRKMAVYPGADAFSGLLKKELGHSHPHYEIETAILSTGIYDLVAHSPAARGMDQVWASRVSYDRHGRLSHMRADIDPVAKTAYLLLLQKGVTAEEFSEIFPENDPRGPSAIHAALHKHVPIEELRRRARRTLYVGDGATDFHAFDSVRLGGGVAILVYDPKDEKGRRKAIKVLEADRVDAIAPADYREGSLLSNLIVAHTRRLIELDAIFHFYEMKAKLVDLADTAALPKISQKQAKGLGAKFERFADSKVPHKKLLPAHRVR